MATKDVLKKLKKDTEKVIEGHDDLQDMAKERLAADTREG